MNKDAHYVKNGHLIEKEKAIIFAQELMTFLLTNYHYGDYRFNVMNISGLATEHGIKLSGATTEVCIYDALIDEDELGCKASHYIIEANGLIYLEIYAWFDNKGKIHVFDIRKISKSLTRGFKLFASQIINEHYEESD